MGPNSKTLKEIAVQKLGLEDLKLRLPVLASKGWNDAVRLLDLFELTGQHPGASCTMQVLSYDTGEWLQCELKGKDAYSLTQWNKVIRGELGWDGAIRVCVAAK